MAGTLSATVAIGAGANPQFAGGGALSAVVLPQFPRSPALAGAGALAAQVVPVVPTPGPLAGAGSLAALWSQIYPVPAALLGSGQLGVAGLTPVVPASPNFVGGDGVGGLSASAVNAAPVTLDYAGLTNYITTAANPATVTQSQPMSATAAGAGRACVATVAFAVTGGPVTNVAVSASMGSVFSSMQLLAAIPFNNNTSSGYTLLLGVSGIPYNASNSLSVTITLTPSTAKVAAYCFLGSAIYINCSGLGQVVSGYGSGGTPAIVVPGPHVGHRVYQGYGMSTVSANPTTMSPTQNLVGSSWGGSGHPAFMEQDAAGGADVSFGFTPNPTTMLWSGAAVELNN